MISCVHGNSIWWENGLWEIEPIDRPYYLFIYSFTFWEIYWDIQNLGALFVILVNGSFSLHYEVFTHHKPMLNKRIKEWNGYVKLWAQSRFSHPGLKAHILCSRNFFTCSFRSVSSMANFISNFLSLMGPTGKIRFILFSMWDPHDLHVIIVKLTWDPHWN